MNRLLALDLSTTATGFALWDLETRQLLDFGAIKPDKKGLSKLNYPKKQLYMMRNLAEKLVALITAKGPSIVLIEEVNRHKSRMSGKTLDGMHYILLEYLPDDYLTRIRYMDSDGSQGWRTKLGLKLSENDRRANAEHSKLNRKLKGQNQLVIINKKHLAARYVNQALGTNFDVDQDATANDIVDAIGLGLARILDSKIITK